MQRFGLQNAIDNHCVRALDITLRLFGSFINLH